MSNEKFLRLSEVKRKTSLSKTTIYDWIKKGKFPKMIHLGERCSVWTESSINEWMERQVEASQKNSAKCLESTQKGGF